ncbi:PadR family transcriptional regulator [Micromonospora sp. WMMD1102]|uniref:PadR family transcriptional regulator n=1 Tax=Micromonospora sp. WMMD1102 TaxID=3016105 RepID=UPI0024151464|nr:PadR family transcriptional regulator [Micromonospora sp. WMMD1102]MDG4784723.1 PadR family transcriptional regulator [Micromonospora sp. WMMD1102]
MTTVFGHGRLRLYLLKLLDGGPKHGYELIRLLEERFLGLYAPSAGTIYPRLARLEAEGLVAHDAVGGRKVYRITEAGRAELRQRADEVASLESEICASVSDLAKLAGEIRSEVRGSVRDLKQELRAAVRESRLGDRRPGPGAPYPNAGAAESGGPTGTRPGERPAAGGPGAGGPAGGWSAAGGPAEQGDGPSAEFERQLLLFVTEVRTLARSGRFTEAQLGTAARLLHGALDGLRRLLR